MMYSIYTTKYTREHILRKKNPSNEPYNMVGLSFGREERNRNRLWKAQQEAKRS